MRDYITLGPTPAEEPCAQVGSPDFEHLARVEMRAYLAQLLRILGAPPEGATLRIRWFPHDYGRYGEVCAEWDEGDSVAAQWCLNAEGETPEYWDTQARADLTAAGYTTPKYRDEQDAGDFVGPMC